MKGPEAQLMRAVMTRLAYMDDVHAMRLNAGLTILGKGASKRAIRGCEPGTPDVLVMLPGGQVVWLELKAPKGRVSAKQAAWHDMARAMGHRVHVVRTVDEAMEAVTG